MVGWATADHLRTELVADALTAACRERRPAPAGDLSLRPRLSVHQSAIRHAGKGVRRPPVRRPHRAVLGQRPRRIVLRHHQTANCSTRSSWPSRAAARTAIFDFIEGWYNLHRLHSSLGYRSPAEYETALAA